MERPVSGPCGTLSSNALTIDSCSPLCPDEGCAGCISQLRIACTEWARARSTCESYFAATGAFGSSYAQQILAAIDAAKTPCIE